MLKMVIRVPPLAPEVLEMVRYMVSCFWGSDLLHLLDGTVDFSGLGSEVLPDALDKRPRQDIGRGTFNTNRGDDL